MKKYYFFILPLFFLCTAANGQGFYSINFDDNTYLDRFYFDTLQNPNCKWQIGKPSKTVFNTALTQPRALLTDALNPLPANDTSVFYFYHKNQHVNYFFYLSFAYQMHGDSTYYGLIEMSPDKGQNWVNLLTDDTLYDIDVFEWGYLPKPTLKGSTSGWTAMTIDMFNWNTDNSNKYPLSLQNADTVIYRFTYISGNSFGLYDGWMIDDLEHGDHSMSIIEFSKNNFLHIYPNPYANKFTLQVKDTRFTQGTLMLKNILGETCLQTHIQGTQHTIETENLPAGIYILEVHTEKGMLGRQKIMKH